MQTKRHILTMLAVLIYTFSHAQTNSITGSLRDAKSGDVGLNPYYQSNFSYTLGSRAVTVGATWRIGKMDLERQGRQGAAY